MHVYIYSIIVLQQMVNQAMPCTGTGQNNAPNIISPVWISDMHFPII